ncbi:MAG: YicC family protein [Oscillospiraceae bacterium]|nr:YicC family protein [Oscillospiraceae bacterium]
MIASMTGYGRAEGTHGKQNITIEVKSVNGRYLDCHIRTGALYLFLEEPVKARLNAALSRGKVSAFVTIDSAQADNAAITVNASVAEGYMQAAAQLAAQLGKPNDLSVTRLLTLPDVIATQRSEQDNDALQAAVLDVLDHALTQLTTMRRREGENLKADLLERCFAVEALLEQIVALAPQATEAYRTKIDARMRELLGDEQFDPQRVLAEAALFADKAAIDEEIVRLRSHIKQMRDLLDKGGGRKLDFLMQEFHREANTIGSKCNDADMARIVVDLKAEIEKMREQVQNIE